MIHAYQYTVPVLFLLILTTMLIITTAVLLSLFFPFYWYYTHHCSKNRTSSTLPPGNFGWLPFLGDTLSFLSPHFSFSTGTFLNDNIKRYSKIFRCHVFGHPTIVSCDAGFNSFVLQNEERLFVSSYPQNIPNVLGEQNLLVTTGETHRQIRALTLRLLMSVKYDEHGRFLADIEDIVIQLIASWKNNNTLVFCDEAKKFTFGVIVKQILSLGFGDDKTSQMLDNFKTFMKGLVSMPIKLPGTPYTKAIEAKHKLANIARKLLRKRKENAEKTSGDELDFMDVLLARSDLKEEEVVALVIDLLLGGYETTAMLISIIVRLLCDHPKVLMNLREEHREIVARGQQLDWDAYSRMTFTHCVTNEALRFGNVVKFVHRKTIKPIKYKDYEIPAGWKVLPIFTGVHLDPSLHDDPLQLQFNPWRWQKDGEVAKGNNFMPFGGGKRLCPEMELARVETAFFLLHFILKYSWCPLKEDDMPFSLPYTDSKHGLQISIQHLEED